MHVILSIEKGLLFKHGGVWYVIDAVSDVGFTASKTHSLDAPVRYTNHEFGKLIVKGEVVFFNDPHVGRYVLEGHTKDGKVLYLTPFDMWGDAKRINTPDHLSSFPNEDVAKLVKADDYYGIVKYNVIPYDAAFFRFAQKVIHG